MKPPRPAVLRQKLLRYFAERGRDLPWRHLSDPYAIWVSEVLLQQTQVATVVGRFQDFMRRFPDVRRLAAASEGKVCEALAGMGYYQRARNLHRAAVVIVDEHGGRLPDTVEGLRALPGVGEYTAAAVGSIAFGISAPAVDGNLVRVLSRVFALPGRRGDLALERAVRALAAQLVVGPTPGNVNQALMDIGAVVCRPAVARCEVCPLRAECLAHAQGRPTAFPEPRLRAEPRRLDVAFAWIRRRGAVLLEQRPLAGLWPGLWELPSATGPTAAFDLSRRLGVALGPMLVAVSHALSHRRVRATVHVGAVVTPGERQRYVRAPLDMPLSGLARKAIESVLAV